MTSARRTAWLPLLALAAACSSGGGAPGDGVPASDAASDTAAPDTTPSDTTPSDTTPSDTTESGADPGAVRTEAVVLESSDGAVSLEVPAGVRVGAELGIDVIDVAALDGLDGESTIGAAYRLRPVDLELPEPLIVTFRPPPGSAPDGPAAARLAVAVVQHGGVLSAEIEGRTGVDQSGALVHRAAIDRFGELVLVDSGVIFELSPAAVADLAPGDSFEATLTARAGERRPPAAFDLQTRWRATGATTAAIGEEPETAADVRVEGDDAVALSAIEVTCDVVGSGTHGVELRVDLSDPPLASVQFVVLDGESECGDVGR